MSTYCCCISPAAERKTHNRPRRRINLYRAAQDIGMKCAICGREITFGDAVHCPSCGRDYCADCARTMGVCDCCGDLEFYH